MKTINKSPENITTFDEHLDNRYGKIGTMKRTEFEIKAKAFAIGEVIKEKRHILLHVAGTISRKNRFLKKLHFKN